MKMHLRTVVWTPYDDPGHEYFSLYETDEGFEFNSVIAMSFDYEPLRVEYRLLINQDWYTQAVEVKLWQGSHRARLRLRVDEQQRWWRGTRELTDCRGCVDVDLSLTPATNTLPIRRLALADGESGTTTTAWIQFPSLKIRPFPQQYTRLSEDEYVFASLEDKFKAKLHVDDLGLVTDYIGGWQAITQSPQ